MKPSADEYTVNLQPCLTGSQSPSCEVLAYLCSREQESFLTPHIAPASRAIDASPSLSLSGRVKCIRLMLCLSFYEWRCIYPGEQMILATFLEKTSLDRAPGRFADYLFVPKHQKADVLLTTVLGPLRREPLRSPCESGIARIMGCNLHILDQGNGASLCRMCFVCGRQGTNGELMSSRVHRCESRSLTHALIFYSKAGSEV